MPATPKRGGALPIQSRRHALARNEDRDYAHPRPRDDLSPREFLAPVPLRRASPQASSRAVASRVRRRCRSRRLQMPRPGKSEETAPGLRPARAAHSSRFAMRRYPRGPFARSHQLRYAPLPVIAHDGDRSPRRQCVKACGAVSVASLHPAPPPRTCLLDTLPSQAPWAAGR